MEKYKVNNASSEAAKPMITTKAQEPPCAPCAEKKNFIKIPRTKWNELVLLNRLLAERIYELELVYNN